MSADGQWTILTGHGHVLVEVARTPEARVRDISAAAGITERAVHAILADLEAAGYIRRNRTGRRTTYIVNPDRPFRHAAQEGLRIGPFLDLMTGHSGAAPVGPGPADGSPVAEPDRPYSED